MEKMRFKITNDKLKMEIDIKDLVWLFHSSPDNIDYHGEECVCKIKHGKTKEFIEWIVEMLKEDSAHDDNNPAWGQPFEDIFNKIFEGYEVCEEFIIYPEDDSNNE